MSGRNRKHQKKVERKNAKRKNRRQQLLKRNQQSLAEKIKSAAAYPVSRCAVDENLWDVGMGCLILVRELPDHRIAYSSFLLDVNCLGVKDAFADVLSLSDLEEGPLAKMWKSDNLLEIDPCCARKLVEEAVAYARNLGFEPHADYQKARQIFGDINSSECMQTFKFGRDGKPLYVAGPYDSEYKSRRIVETLHHRLGAGGYEYILPVLNLNDGFLDDQSEVVEIEDASLHE